MRIGLLILFVLLSATHARASAISDAVAGCTVGTMCEIPNAAVTGLTAAMFTERNGTEEIIGFCSQAAWDTRRKKMFLASNSHSAAENGKILIWDDATSTITEGAHPTTFGLVAAINHCYNHIAVNPDLGKVYLRRYDASGGFALLNAYDIAGNTWATASSTLPASNITGALNYFPEMGKLVHFGAGGAFTSWQVGDANWSSTVTACSDIGPYSMQGVYSPVHHAVFAGGGGGTARGWCKVDRAGTLTQLTSAPAMINVGGGGAVSLLTVDPVSGDPLLFDDTTRGIYRYKPLTNTWETICTTCSQVTYPVFQNFQGGSPTVYGCAATPMQNFGAILFICAPSQILSTPPKAYVYKLTAPNSFQTKCQSQGVLTCLDFDREAGDIYYNWSAVAQPNCTTAHAAAGHANYVLDATRVAHGNAGSTTGNPTATCVWPLIDSTVKYNGASSLKIRTPNQSGDNAGGTFSIPFRRKGDGTFQYIGRATDPNSLSSTIYAQARIRLDANMINNAWVPGNGYKMFALYGNPPTGANSSGIEITTVSNFNLDMPAMYGQQGADDYGKQDVAGCPYGTGGGTYPAPPCIYLQPDTWHELTWRVDVGAKSCDMRQAFNAVTNPRPGDTRVRMWIDGTLAVDYPNACMNMTGIGGNNDGAGLGSLILWSFQTGRNISGDNLPEASMWFDDVIISTSAIAFGDSGGGPPPSTTYNQSVNDSVNFSEIEAGRTFGRGRLRPRFNRKLL